MKIEFTNSKQITIISIVVSFVLSLILLAIIKPIWIMQVNKKSGSSSIYTPLLLLYSILFANITGIVVFIMVNRKNEETSV
jgi:hypothetical protein